MTIDHLDITCGHGEDESVFLTRIDRSAEGLRWRHDQDAPWGGEGSYDPASGLWEWYERERHGDQIKTRSHTTNEHLILRCHLCHDRLVVGTAKWQQVCDLIAVTEKHSVSLAEFRAVVSAVH
jgi:hypothetical protein